MIMIDEEMQNRKLDDIIQELTDTSVSLYASEGLSKNKVADNALTYGKNSFSQVKKVPMPLKVVYFYMQPLNLILLLASILSIGTFFMCPDDTSSFYLGCGIFFVTCVNTAIELYRSTRQIPY